jgi:hypothetical protein
MSVRYLTDFLIEPSPILLKLYKYSIEKSRSNTLAKHSSDILVKTLMNNNSFGEHQFSSNNFRKSSWIFEYLRDTAIDCLCL